MNSSSPTVQPEPSPWSRPAPDVVADLGSSAVRGLEHDDVERRLSEFGRNELDREPPVPLWRRILHHISDPLSLLLIAATAISVAVWVVEGAEGLPIDAMVIFVIVVANAMLGLWQEAKAEDAVAALAEMTSPTATLLRSGVTMHVAAADVVPGDVMILNEGDAVIADGRLLEVATLRVAEAALTGESEAVLKVTDPVDDSAVLGDRTNMVFGGTTVVTGRGTAVVTATGMASEMGRIAGMLNRVEDQPTPLTREINRIGKLLGVIVVIIAVIVIATIGLTNELTTAEDYIDVLLVGVSLAVAAVPEGLAGILSLVLAIGVQRLARHNAIVKKLSGVETLGSASAICSDKTGTLTMNEMTIKELVTPSGSASLRGVGYRPEGELHINGVRLVDGPIHDEAQLLVGGGSLANTATLRIEGDEIEVFGDPTELAFLVAGRKLGVHGDVTTRFRRISEVPFTAERRLMSTVIIEEGREDRPLVITKGAPDVLLVRCTHERVAGTVIPLSDDRRIEILQQVDGLANQALRTLGVAYSRPAAGIVIPDAGESLENDLVYLGVVGIIDPPRPEAAPAVAEAQRAGIRIRMITGDHPATAERIAERLGIGDSTTKTFTGSELDTMSDTELQTAVAQGTIFARVAPEHKLRIVGALQAQDHIVAMTGDGVNDAPALKAADIGIAMGQTGTEVSKQAADMILADDNFATIVLAVREGRAIFANIRKFLRFLLSSNIGEVLTVFLGVVFAGLLGLTGAGVGVVAVPLVATQILWINLLTDTAPALALGIDPAVDDLMAHPPRRLTDRVIDAEMMYNVLFIGVVMAVATLLAFDARLPGGLIEGDSNLGHARTVAFTTLVLAQLFNTLNARSATTSAFVRLGSNKYLLGAIGISIVLQLAVIYVPFLATAFSTTPLNGEDWLMTIGAASAVLWADEIRKLIKRRRPQST